MRAKITKSDIAPARAGFVPIFIVAGLKKDFLLVIGNMNGA